MSIWAEAGQIISATMELDQFGMRSAYRASGAWLVFSTVTVIGAFIVLWIYKMIPWLDRNLERSIIVYTYLIIAYIIFAGVLQRFLPFIDGQPAWSTTIPPLFFMIMAWFGCSYNVRLRTHLSFAEFRTNMPRTMQLGCLILDAVLWFGFCIIVVTTTARLTVTSVSNFQIVLGTDNVMQWWFLITVPVAFVMMAARVIENLLEDFENYRTGQPLIRQAVIGGDV